MDGFSNSEPQLLKSTLLQQGAFGELAWNQQLNTHNVLYSDDGLAATWKDAPIRGLGQRLWVPLESQTFLNSATLAWDIGVAGLGEAQLGVGFMLLWDVGPDWGFYGYLGASHSAWAYDVTTGDVVVGTNSIEGGLPTVREGLVTVEVHLPRSGPNWARFVVQGVASKPIALPEASIVVPAACLFFIGQKVTLTGLRPASEDWVPR